MLEQNYDIKEKIIQSIHARTQAPISYFEKDNHIYLVFCIVNVFLLGMMFNAFGSNPVMMKVMIGLLFFQVLILVLNLYILIRFKKLNDFNDSLKNIIRNHAHFYKNIYQIWLLVKPFTIMIASFCITAMTDQKSGQYVINNVGMYVLIYVFIYLITYILYKSISNHYSQTFLDHLNEMIKENDEISEHHFSYNTRVLKVFLILTSIVVVTLVILTIRYL